MLTEVNKKVATEYICSFCEYNTSRKSSYDKHLFTSKHNKLTKKFKNDANEKEYLNLHHETSQKSNYGNQITISTQCELTNVNTKVAKSCKKVANDIIICDNCNKIYKSRVGLWKHKKTCCIDSGKNKNDNCNENNKEESELSDKEVIMYLLKENSEFKNMMMKLVENGINHDNNHHNTNTINNNNNKTFNLQVFLNETCKDAMNITDFMESLQPQLSDLESIGKLGFVEGISKIIIKGLKALDETERPIHCTDKKRETVYVKDENKWEKEDTNKTRLRKAIKYMANENIMLLPKWKVKHPDYLDSSSDCSDKYNNIVIEVLGGDDDSNTSENKIIRKIAKEFVIDK